jgi:D-alanine-D-alanine ligase
MKKSVNRTVVAIICGGQSSEHEISCISAAGVLAAIDRERFDPVLIGITQAGNWVHVVDPSILESKDGQLPHIAEDLPPVVANVTGFIVDGKSLKIDIVFPLLHGPYGEDGTLQGFLELAGIRYVGSGVLASAIAMDKSIAKLIFQAHGLNVSRGGVTSIGSPVSGEIGDLEYPLFVKPARSGSSRGTSKVHSSKEFSEALIYAGEYDRKIIVEEAIIGREIECGVLEIDGVVTASRVGEIRIHEGYEFYDFDAKYLDSATTVLFPDDLPTGIEEEIQEAAKVAFAALNCEGLARVDFFLTTAGRIIINEINTMPGFTQSSMFPKLWDHSGMSYGEVITILLESALCRSTSITR